MSCDELCKNTLAPLFLRLVLAGIFIYHGATKIIGPDNQLGAAWADRYWQKASEPPPDVLAHIQDGMPEKEANDIKDRLHEAYARTTPAVPGALRYQAAQMTVAWGELVGGIALLFGFLTRLAALGEIVIQVGAVFWVTWAQGFSFARGGGYEYNLILMAACLALVFMGAGYLSVDHWLFGARGGKTHPAVSAPHQAGLAGKAV